MILRTNIIDQFIINDDFDILMMLTACSLYECPVFTLRGFSYSYLVLQLLSLLSKLLQLTHLEMTFDPLTSVSPTTTYEVKCNLVM